MPRPSPTWASRRAWGPVRIVKNLLAGFVPVVPWIAERRNTAETEALLSRAYLAGEPERG